jgi:putative mRNA 3-end processing factor
VAKSSRAAAAAPVAWRDGVHLTGTPIWCDARRRRDVCFVSSADRVATTGHGQLIATTTTLALVGASADAGHLAVPLRKPFTLGTLRLELLASGRCLGSAALHVDARGRTALYAGPIRTVDGALGEPAADVRACDALVVAAPFGEPHHAFEPLAEVAGRVIAWVRAERAAKHIPIAVVDAPLDGLEVAAKLAEAGFAIAAGKSIRDTAARLPDYAVRFVAKDADVIVRSERDRIKSDAPTALVSGRAIDPHAYVLGFAWPFAAGRAELLAWIEQTRAKDVFVTGACAESIAVALGPRARVLGPPQQMTLFEAPRAGGAERSAR